ncbi:MAG: ATP synthase F1 subunit epsilon [Candidatus Eremiobacteraeota bacterium]|nr:ATP synthase F1 subunit epsilon [Candidatus Eremiobacteraeota bacterium]
MPSAVPFTLVTPAQVVFEGEAELVIAVTTEGEEGILPHHAPLLAALKPGILRANVRATQSEQSATTRLELATGQGFVQALPDRVTVLVDEAVRFEDVVVSDARDELEGATQRQNAAGDNREVFAREQAAIDFATAKLRLTGHG